MALARACFEMAVDHNPEFAPAQGNLGVVLWQSGELEPALEHLYKALELDPEDPDILHNSAVALLAAGETESAAGLLKAYLQRHPDDEGAWSEYEDILSRLNGQWNPKGLSSDTAGIYRDMALRLMDAGDIQGSVDAVDRAMKIDPESPAGFLLLGRLHLELDQPEDAVRIFEEALNCNGDREFVLAAGGFLVAGGLREEAMGLYRKFLAGKSDPAVQAALDGLA